MNIDSSSSECLIGSRRRLIRASGLLLAAISLLTIAGCEQMPAASSVKTVQILAALRTAISTKSIERVKEVQQRIEQLRDEQEFSDQEFDMLTRIIDLAISGDWKSAEQLCHRFQKAQLR